MAKTNKRVIKSSHKKIVKKNQKNIKNTAKNSSQKINLDVFLRAERAILEKFFYIKTVDAVSKMRNMLELSDTKYNELLESAKTYAEEISKEIIQMIMWEIAKTKVRGK